MNSFRYDMPQPEGEEPFSATVEATDCPWRDGRQLVRIALQGRDIDRRHRPAGTIVFLADVSGSMGDENKLPLVKQSLAMLVEELTENDTITIVTYAGEAGLRLPPTSGDRKKRILSAIASLTAGGSTHGSAGIALAYERAAERHITGGVNRVVLATDGDTSVLREVPLGDGRRAFAAASKDLRFAAAVAAFGMILRESEHRCDATLSLVAEIAGGALGVDLGGYRAEFLDLVRRAKSIHEAGSAR